MNSKLIEMSSNNWKMMDQHRNKSYFSLEGQNITHLPILICPEMKNVEYLNLSKNLLETINGEIFNNFQNVKEIDLSDNSLANIDYVLIKLPKIRYINLYNNLIKTLTYEVSLFKKKNANGILNYEIVSLFSLEFMGVATSWPKRATPLSYDLFRFFTI